MENPIKKRKPLSKQIGPSIGAYSLLLKGGFLFKNNYEKNL